MLARVIGVRAKAMAMAVPQAQPGGVLPRGDEGQEGVVARLVGERPVVAGCLERGEVLAGIAEVGQRGGGEQRGAARWWLAHWWRNIVSRSSGVPTAVRGSEMSTTTRDNGPVQGKGNA